ncbi:hypothetical protein MNBD_ALPHA06-1463 [hydrothermal vent metagenome]|uniref:DUF304 domain-containing protein n=1 Tax=hydrothermal vent metagenome TaxID=652676 RepID=A0A3B0S571_9ZZZZ
MFESSNQGGLGFQLLSDEKQIWSDKPHKIPLFITAYFVFIILFLGGFFILPMTLVLITKDVSYLANMNMQINGNMVSSDTSLDTIRFALIGVIILFAIHILLVSWYLRFRMSEIYVITTKRGILVRPLFPKAIISLNLQNLTSVSRSGGKHVGTLTFHARGEVAGTGLFRNIFKRPLSFLNINTPEKVENLILQHFGSNKEVP